MRLETLQVVVAAQAVAIAALLVVSFGHSVFRQSVDRVRRARVEATTAALARMLAGDPGSETLLGQAVVAAAALPIRARSEALSVLAATIEGEHRGQLTHVARLTGVVDHASRATRSRRRASRLRGVRILGRIGATPGHLTELLTDPWDEIRLEAARLVLIDRDAEAVTGLIRLLNDPSPHVRFVAKDTLIRCGAAATDEVLASLQHDGDDALQRAALLEIAVHVAEPAFLPLTARFAGDRDPRVRVHAAQLAAAVGARASVVMLIDLLGDADEEVRAAATEGLGQIGHWRAAPMLVSRLTDPAWRVRQAAGLALRRLGAPGVLYLRRALDGTDRYGRDMARQILDLPDVRAVG
jgi:hypothetical protein